MAPDDWSLPDTPKSGEECLKKHESSFSPDSCPPVWDSIFCWPPVQSGSHIHVPCHQIFPFIEPDQASAFRVCSEDGEWSHGNWTNYSACEEKLDDSEVKEFLFSPLDIAYVILICSVISLVSLLVTLFIFFYFKSIQCSRIQVHRNLALSLVLHTLMMSAIALPALSSEIDNFFKAESILCRTLLSLKMYSAMSCVFWMFVEGLLLHTSVAVSVFRSKPPPFPLYYTLGWGAPFVCVGCWVLLMCSQDFSSPCWRGFGRSPFIWFITGPMILALSVNAIFLVNIIRILITKMRIRPSVETEQIKKAVKATALLFPLLGITHLLFCINPRDDSVLEHAYMMANAVLQSSQGFFVSLLYCFLNSEVQNVLATAYARYILRKDPRRSIRRSRSSRVLGSTASTTLPPEVLLEGTSPPSKTRLSLVQTKGRSSSVFKLISPAKYSKNRTSNEVDKPISL